ncbi:MAG: 4Fe-4S binding protein [Deltaproteobacteria bacterium]|nr:4Fe-4S binding protein [Deltaproteobacteria bacterium]
MLDLYSHPQGIQVDPSRCLRLRFNKSECRQCLESCPVNALQIQQSIKIDRRVCSQCLLCLSACPTGCFEARDFDFYLKIAKIKKIHSPVIACSLKPDLPAHEKFPCFGFLSEEHIITLTVALERRLQVNLTACADCRNGFIVPILQNRLLNLAAKTSLEILERIRLVEDKSDLIYAEVSYDRRNFFKILKNLSFQGSRDFYDQISPTAQKEKPYLAKNLPEKRKMLNRSLRIMPDRVSKEVLKNYYYHATLHESCNSCWACVAMCPTGALKRSQKDGEGRLLFNSSLCTGCGLCENFCSLNALHLHPGFSGPHPFEFIPI